MNASQIQRFIENFFGPEYIKDAEFPIRLIEGKEDAFIGIGRQQYGDPIAIYDGSKCKESHKGIMNLIKESMDTAIERYERTFEPNNETMQYDNLNEAYVGMGYMPDTQPLVVYDSDKCIEVLYKDFSKDPNTMEDSDPYEDAIEWYSYNTEGTYCGTGTPILAKIFDASDLDQEN
ncbi:TPA: hypothetical protein HA278_07220 [Candidatus Woesearchaeota archaeon]|nr:hypothetical protein [Candidatus Woesearchaeota archaeon]